jgi:DNA-binding NarL/FixJ family response regulator
MIRILIADDHAIVRQGLQQIVGGEADMQVVGEAANAGEVLAFLRKQACDLVVQDISMPGQDGLGLLRDLKREFPRLAVLVLSVHPSEQFGVRALTLGAAGYLNKKTVPEELVLAIRKVVGGGRYVTPALADQLAAHVSAEEERAPHEALSEREYQVMRMIAGGRRPKEIASDLGLSPKSINAYRARVLEKMGMKTNADLTRYALVNRLLDNV